MNTLLQQHQTRFTLLEKKLEAAFTEVLARLEAMDHRPNPPPPGDGAPQIPVPVPNPAPVLGAAPPRAHEPRLASPKPFEGDFDLCRGFLVQCELVFTHQPTRYPTEGSRIAFIMSLLSGRALRWATAAVGQSDSLATSYSAFRAEFKFVFDHPEDGGDAASRLHSIQQGSRSVADYTLEFRILAADSGWGDKALQSAYRRGLSEAIKDGLLRDRPTSYNALIELALLMDQRLRERRAERVHRPLSTYTRPAPADSHAPPRGSPPAAPAEFRGPSYGSPPAAPGAEEPMQLGRSRLAGDERDRRLQQRLCLYCGQAGHFIRECSTRPKGRAL